MEYLKANRPAYHWVGVYRLEGDNLILGPYVGPETDHRVIPVGRGVCGTAVAENRNQIVGDVRALSNYLACNLETRSEIVVLIRDPETTEILGQIDVDGTELNGFDSEDEIFLEEVGVILAPYLSRL
jgi:GAF domain-containing protein